MLNKNTKALIIEVILFILVLLDIIFLKETILLSTAIGVGIVGLAFYFFHKKEDIVFFCCAAILGPIAEIICIKFGIWQYSNPVILGIPLWLPIFWGFAYLFGRRLRDTIFNLTQTRIHYKHHPSIENLRNIMIYDAVMYVLLIVSLCMFWRMNILLFFIMLFLTLLSLIKYHEKADICFVIIAGIIGPVGEIICVYFGVWNYSNPDIFGIPIWLILAHAYFGIIVRRTSITIVNYFFEESVFNSRPHKDLEKD